MLVLLHRTSPLFGVCSEQRAIHKLAQRKNIPRSRLRSLYRGEAHPCTALSTSIVPVCAHCATGRLEDMASSVTLVLLKRIAAHSTAVRSQRTFSL